MKEVTCPGAQTKRAHSQPRSALPQSVMFFIDHVHSRVAFIQFYVMQKRHDSQTLLVK